MGGERASGYGTSGGGEMANVHNLDTSKMLTSKMRREGKQREKMIKSMGDMRSHSNDSSKKTIKNKGVRI